MTKEEQINQISLIDFCYNAERNSIHEEFWKTKDVEKFADRIREIQDLRYERLKDVFEEIKCRDCLKVFKTCLCWG